MTRSLYKRKEAYKTANPIAKMSSKYQHKINNLKKNLHSIYVYNHLKKIQLGNFSRLMDYLLENNRVTKEEIKRFLTTKKEEIRKLNLEREIK